MAYSPTAAPSPVKKKKAPVTPAPMETIKPDAIARDQAFMQKAQAPTSSSQKPIDPTPQKTQTGTTFNPDNSVDYNVGGQNFKLSRAEYNSILAAKGSNQGRTQAITPIARQALSAEAAARFETERSNALRFSSQTAEVDRRLLQQQAGKQQAQQLQQKEGQALLPSEADSFSGSSSVLDKNLSGLTFGATEVLKDRTGIDATSLRNTVSGAAQVIDSIKSFFTGGKATKAAAAEATLNNALATVSNDIELVKQGVLSPETVLQDIMDAEQSLNSLESSVKGFGQLNLREWITKGREIQTSVEESKRKLQVLRAALAAAGQQGQLLSARANYGL